MLVKTLMETTDSSSPDNDGHKGATEDDRTDSHRGSPGLDENGMPNDSTAIAQDAVGARADESQG